MSTVLFAGFSRVGGVLKFRTANDVKRIDQLRKLGDTDVVILALDSAMSKNAAAKFVLANLASGAYMVDTVEAESVLTNLIKDENPFAKPAKKAVKIAKTPAKVVVKMQQPAKVTSVAKTPRSPAEGRKQFIEANFG
jgi:hypothetical protein